MMGSMPAEPLYVGQFTSARGSARADSGQISRPQNRFGHGAGNHDQIWNSFGNSLGW